MRHFIGLDIDNPFDPEVTLIVNGQVSKMSNDELRKLMLDCEWALNTIRTAQNHSLGEMKCVTGYSRNGTALTIDAA